MKYKNRLKRLKRRIKEYEESMKTASARVQARTHKPGSNKK